MFGNIKSLKLHTKSAVAAAGLLALVALPSAVEAASGPFAALAGTWSGNGTITMSNGAKERIRCRAEYNVAASGSDVDLTLRCASDSYNFNLSGNIGTDGHSLRGQWTENSRGIGGTVSGTLQGERMQVHIDSSGFSGDLGITTRGRTQCVSMDSRGGGQIVKGNISMAKQ